MTTPLILQEGPPAFVDYTRESLDRASRAVGGDEPVHMVNLLRFHREAIYEAPGDGREPCSGREAYFHRYAPAFGKIAKGADYGLVWRGEARSLVVGPPSERWDEIVIVRYASFSLLRRIMDDPDYALEADPHRRAAVADWRFILTTQAAPSR
ncbi:hypothetical protein ACFPPF_16470 [Xenophilus aerolatus]|nr:hypothetical protein [Xenophilus aerolatus]